MQSNTYRGQELSFYDLIKSHKIEIPIIQRDYAQGRVDKSEIRSAFLNALYECIIRKKTTRLDFVYGSCDGNAFQPLDGQQRLTTLFLLYWYSAVKDGVLNAVNKEMLIRFSYETRITSRDFCHAIVTNSIFDLKKSDKLSNIIIDSNWFFLSWKKDPTIDSMLRVIDDMHQLFFDVSDLWSILTSTSSPIKFYYVELENIGLTDDLYIKMNARGKLLTSYENFKASFQKHIDDNKWEEGIGMMDSFAYKIDTTWTDYFWYSFKKNNTIDDALLRFIATIAMIRQAIERVASKTDDRLQLLIRLQDRPSVVRPDHFTQLSYFYLVKCLDLYSSSSINGYDLSLPFPMWRQKIKTSIISEIVYENISTYYIATNSASYSMKVLFFAQMEYLQKNNAFDLSKYQDWMRVIRNIVSKGDVDKDGNRPDIIRSPQTFEGVVNLISELSEGSGDIYDHIASLGTLKSQFAKDQIEEERKKAKIIITYPHLKKLIFKAEDNELLRGRIDFILYCMNYDNDVKNFDSKFFEDIVNVFSVYFNSEDGLNNKLRRAMLAIEVNGKYSFYEYWWSYWNIVGANKRRLFDKFRELEYYIYSEYKEYFKNLVLLLIDKDLVSIASDFTPDKNFPIWKKRLIKEPDLLDRKAKSNYIAIMEDESYCYILKSKRPRDIDGSVKVE